jgi:hypothetical protein
MRCRCVRCRACGAVRACDNDRALTCVTYAVHDSDVNVRIAAMRCQSRCDGDTCVRCMRCRCLNAAMHMRDAYDAASCVRTCVRAYVRAYGYVRAAALRTRVRQCVHVRRTMRTCHAFYAIRITCVLRVRAVPIHAMPPQYMSCACACMQCDAYVRAIRMYVHAAAVRRDACDAYMRPHADANYR